MREVRMLMQSLLRVVPDFKKAPSQASVDIRRILDALTPASFGIRRFPSSEELVHDPIMYYGMFRQEGVDIETSMFALTRSDSLIPLHDHPGIYGFIKVIQGSVQITSYTALSDCLDERGLLAVRFDGTQVIDSSSPSIYFEPHARNFHEVRAVDAGSFFFDVLVPGYQRNVCNYFEVVDEGSALFLRLIPPPSCYTCHEFTVADFLALDNS